MDSLLMVSEPTKRDHELNEGIKSSECYRQFVPYLFCYLAVGMVFLMKWKFVVSCVFYYDEDYDD